MTEQMYSSHAGGNGKEGSYAPPGWSIDSARKAAAEEGLELTDAHIDVMHALQRYFGTHDKPDFNMRELHDALDERFHVNGGMKYLYGLFPGGPVAQGCRLAGLEVPAGAQDASFGSVQ